MVKALLARTDLDVNAGSPLYMLADKDANVPMMRLLMSRNDTNVNQRGRVGSNTAFHRAVTKSAWKVVDFLLEHKDLDVNAGSPLYNLADSDENIPLLRRLLNRNGTDVNKKPRGGSWTPFSYAILRKAWGVADLLLERKDLDVNTRAPLYRLASAKGGTKRFKILQHLVERNGTDVNQRENIMGRTALFEALYLDNWDAINLLSSHPEIDLNARNKDGETFLLYALLHPYMGPFDKAIRWALEVSTSVVCLVRIFIK